jgi:hypothetical protein
MKLITRMYQELTLVLLKIVEAQHTEVKSFRLTQLRFSSKTIFFINFSGTM